MEAMEAKSMEEADTHIEKNHPTPTTKSTSFCFDCSICLDFAEEPIVTLCGHLYCWKCIYRWVDHHHRQNQTHRPLCPVCKSPLSLSSLVPLYGRGSNSNTTTTNNNNKNSTSTIPPRRPRSLQPNRRRIMREEGPSVLNAHSIFGGAAMALMLPLVLGNGPYNHDDGYGFAGEVEEGEVRSLRRISAFLFCFVFLCLLLF